MSLLDETAPLVTALRAALAQPPSFAAAADQPLHTLYWPADRFDADTVVSAADEARRIYDEIVSVEVVADMLELAWDPTHHGDAQRYATDPAGMKAASFSAWLACTVHQRARARLEVAAVEDLRIDFEDGYGVRADSVEDAHARAAGAAVARALANDACCGRVGLRIKTLTEAQLPRACRTLELFTAELARAGRWPQTLVVTVPKVTHPEQARLGDALLAALERRHDRRAGSIRLEVMVETTESLVGADGRSPLPAIVDAGVPRLLGVHLGVYDFTASFRLSPRHQAPDHTACDLARGLMRMAVGDRVHLSDGASNVRPVGSASQVAAALRQCAAHVTRALSQGYLQGWDMHPGQLIARHVANIAFFRRDFDDVAARLSALVATAVADRGAQTVQGAVIDEPATGRALLRATRRAWRVGAIDATELSSAGLSEQDVGVPSFADLVEQRRAAGKGR